LRYPQRQGFCSFNLLQQVVDGGEEDEIAGRHGLNCAGLQVTACDTFASANNITTTTIVTRRDAFFIFNNFVIAIFSFLFFQCPRNDASGQESIQEFIEGRG
jgi:alcohol dehydrogenase class-P